jgi:hypothetical protein
MADAPKRAFPLRGAGKFTTGGEARGYLSGAIPGPFERVPRNAPAPCPRYSAEAFNERATLREHSASCTTRYCWSWFT